MAEKNRRERLHPSRKLQILQNYRLVWVDAGIDKSNGDCQHTLAQLRNVVNDIKIFQDSDTGVDFLRCIVNEKAFVIASGSIGKDLVPRIHSMPQVDTIYIFCGDRARHKPWSEQWSKIKDVYTRVEPICEALQQSAKQCNEDSTPMSFVPCATNDSMPNLNELEPSFMYTQLFKNALLDMTHERQAIEDFVEYCRDKKAHLANDLRLIDEFQRDYRPDQAIWWYTRECFIYQMLNRALRLLEADIIVNMGFFVHDLHRQIEQLHREQVSQYGGKHLTLYRGQGFSMADFNKLKSTRGGLLSFNSFVSTSTKRNVSLEFATESSTRDGAVGILFVLTIDPALTSTPFADISQFSYFDEKEGEVLFSMHSVFRVARVDGMDKQGRLWEVQLTLTADDDPQLRLLTERMNEEVQGCTGWERIGKLLISVGRAGKAEELYLTLLEQAPNDSDRGHYNHQLGYIRADQGDYKEALSYFEKCLDMEKKTLPANHPSLATSYNSIGSVYSNMGEYSKALTYYEKCLDMEKKTLPANHPSLATSYNNIGSVYDSMGEYSKALSYYEKCLDMRQKTLPANHPDLATSYNNIGSVYDSMGEYSKALSYYEKCLDMRQKTLPANHPNLASSYNNIGLVYDHMGEYSKALAYYEKSLDIFQETLPANHLDLAASSSNIGLVYDHIGEHSKALLFLEKSLDVFQSTLPATHRFIAISHNKLGLLYKDMKEYEKALSCHQEALNIREQSRPANQLDLAQSYNNMGEVYRSMGDNSKALSLYERALEIRETTLQENHPDLATTLHNIGEVYCAEEKYPKALSYLNRGLKIRQHSLPPAHRDIKTSITWREIAKKNM